MVDQTPEIFGVVIPGCSGCYAAGFDPPRPRSIGEIRGDASLAIDFAEGATLAAVPTGIGEMHPGPELDAMLMRDIDEAAERGGMSLAAFLAAAAREKIAVGR